MENLEQIISLVSSSVAAYLIYWIGKIVFFIVRSFYQFKLMKFYLKVGEEKARFLDSCNLPKDHYKDKTISKVEKQNLKN